MRWLPILLLPLAGCNAGGDRPAGNVVAGTGKGGERSFAARDFTGVSVRGPDDVEVRTGAAFSVRAQGDPAVLDRLRIAVDGDRLNIGRQPDGQAPRSRNRVRILVTMPAIARADVAGSGDLTVDRAGSGFAGANSGSGDLTVGRIDGGEVRLATSGSGTIAASGDADSLSAAVAGSGDIVAPDLRVRSARVSLVGSGDLQAAVVGDAQVALAGSGTVDLGPLARCTTQRSGSGQVRCGS